MDTVPYRRCTACHAVIEPGEQHWTLSASRAHYERDYCCRCVGVVTKPLQRSILGQLLEDSRQAELKRRPRR
jgi:Zn-finger nucleic acid-binding protein